MSEQDRLIREELHLEKELGKTARKIWEEGRRVSGYTTWTMKLDLKRVRDYAIQAYKSIEARDVLKAVEQLSREGTGAPWDIEERARELGGTRRELEHLATKIEEREYERTHVRDIREILKGEKK